MTKREAAMTLIDMAGTLRDALDLSYATTQKINEAVTMACGELMIDEILNDRSKVTEEDE